MNETKLYLATLAKIMAEEESHSLNNRESYNLLYTSIHKDLMSVLEHSQYSNAPAIIKQAETLLEELNTLYIVPELRGKAAALITSHYTNELFHLGILNTWFEGSNLVGELGKYKTQIPFIIVAGEEEGIEVLNFANCRIPISLTEYIYLTTQSGKNRIALNRIVQSFILHIPSKHPELCMILDNVYGTAEKIFTRVISTRILMLDQVGVNQIKNAEKIAKYDALTCSADLLDIIAANPYIKGITTISLDALSIHLEGFLHPVLMGFFDELRCMEIQVKEFYSNLLKKNQRMLNLITGDLVNSEGNDQTLATMKKYEHERKNVIESEYRELSAAFSDIMQTYEKIQLEIHDTAQHGMVVSRKIYDIVFQTLFCGMNIDSGIGQSILSRLTTLEYNDCGLVESYITHSKKRTLQFQLVNEFEWEKAKIYIELANLDTLSSELLQNYVSVLSTVGASTGKEYYAQALLLDGSEKTDILQKSLLRGYQPAADALIKEYKLGNSRVDLNILSNALIPEACILKAEDSEKKRETASTKKYTKRFASIGDPNFTYYKIAASQDYAPAIGRIVDSIFDSRFQSTYQLHGDDFSDEKYAGMISNGHALIPLCYYLIEKTYQVNHYREILGIIYFCLNENLSEAMHLLSGINTAKANYCKGNLYEYGRGGVARDYSQALTHYKNAKKLGYPEQYINSKIRKCEERIEEQRVRRESASSYHDDADYSRSYSGGSSYSSSSSLCFITTAACRALKAEDDCEELMLLRNFRDSHLQKNADGEAVVSEYYRIAPILIKYIDELPESKSRYQFLWDEYIGPSCQMIKDGKLDEAKWIYVRMVKSLCKEFSVKVRPSILAILAESL